MIRNEPTAEGAEVGEHLARFADAAFKADPTLRRRCEDCAFRGLTRANACPQGVLDGMKCVLEKTPFYCHVHEGQLCAGWEALIDKKGEPVEAPWPTIGGYD